MTWLITSTRGVAIHSIGAFTSAGVTVPTAFGSARLGLKFFEELPWRDPARVPVRGGRTPLDLAAVTGVARLVTLSLLALEQIDDGGLAGPTPLLLCLPEPRDRFVPAGVLGAICGESGPRIDAGTSRTFAAGRAAVFQALEVAEALLSSRQARAVYLGGADSLVDRQPFNRALRAGRLETSTSTGFVPGEGAVFLRLGWGATPDALALITGVARSQERFTREFEQPNTGAALAKAGRAALVAASTSIAQVGTFIHDAAGDRFGFREAGMALTRLRPRTDPEPQVLTTASSAGELGAAWGPFALGLAAFFAHKQVTPGPATLVLGTSEGADRGAAVVTPAVPAAVPPAATRRR